MTRRIAIVGTREPTPPWPDLTRRDGLRLACCIAERFLAGESIAALTDDYGLSEADVLRSIRAVMRVRRPTEMPGKDGHEHDWRDAESCPEKVVYRCSISGCRAQSTVRRAKAAGKPVTVHE